MAYHIGHYLLRGKTGFSISNRFASREFISQNLEKTSSDRSFDKSELLNTL